MINVDTVYQKVLTLSNKEQRGYITPQEFNLLADKAQLEIINDYFHKIKTKRLLLYCRLFPLTYLKLEVHPY